MSEEMNVAKVEDGGLSTGAQVGIAAFFLGLPFLGMGVEALGLGETGLVLAALGAGGLGFGTKYLLDRSRQGGQASGELCERRDLPLPRLSALDRLKHADWGALFRPLPESGAHEQEKAVEAAPTEEETGEAGQDEVEEDALFTVPQAAETAGIARLTIEQIVRNSEPNSYKIWVGRSLTLPGNPAVQIKFYKQHFRFIGASQRGKSSMVAAFLEIVTRTHDQKHVQLILLDKENLTSNLFAGLPHVAKMRLQSGEVVKMHATNNEQVLRYLIQAVVMMEKRYQAMEQEGIAALQRMPVILVYIEEFLRLKAYFKAQLKTAKDKEQAESDYATLMYCINELAGRGLKARVQLLLCAQVDYADEDFREAMANISCGFSFCVKRDAAMAAGFTNAELLTRNLKANKVGQAVVECPDCNDLVLAPEYDLEQRLLDFEKVHAIHHSPEPAQPERDKPVNTPVNEHVVNAVNGLEKPVNASVNAREYSPAPENLHASSPSYSQSEEVQVVLAQAELQKTGKAVTRTGIRDYLGWNNKQYERIIKPVCDKHGIAVAREA